MAPFRVFYSYSHADIRMLEKLRKHMAMLRRQGLITEWYDREIEAGAQWRQEIERELEAADVILLLVSAEFLASDFCYEQEMIRAVERARSGEALLIGVMLRPVDGWDSTPFAGFQLVPRDARPITKWSDTDEAYTDVAERIRAALEDRARLASASAPGGGELAAAASIGQSLPGRESSPLSTHVGSLSAQARTSTSTEAVDGGLTAEQSATLAMYYDPATPDEELFSPSELALLAKISNAEQRRLQRDQIVASKVSFLRSSYQNLNEMRVQMAKAVAKHEAERRDSTEPGS